MNMGNVGVAYSTTGTPWRAGSDQLDTISSGLTNRRPFTMGRNELELVRDVVLLPHILTIVDTNLREIQQRASLLQSFYVEMTAILLDRMHEELERVRRELKERNIHVVEEEREDFHLHYKYRCQGYEEKFMITRDVAKAAISVKIRRFMESIVNELSHRN